MESFLSKRSILKPGKFSLTLHWLDNPIYIIPINSDISLKRRKDHSLFSSITIRERSRTPVIWKSFAMRSWRNDWLSIILIDKKKEIINVTQCFAFNVSNALQSRCCKKKAYLIRYHSLLCGGKYFPSKLFEARLNFAATHFYGEATNPCFLCRRSFQMRNSRAERVVK